MRRAHRHLFPIHRRLLSITRAGQSPPCSISPRTLGIRAPNAPKCRCDAEVQFTFVAILQISDCSYHRFNLILDVPRVFAVVWLSRAGSLPSKPIFPADTVDQRRGHAQRARRVRALRRSSPRLLFVGGRGRRAGLVSRGRRANHRLFSIRIRAVCCFGSVARPWFDGRDIRVQYACAPPRLL